MATRRVHGIPLATRQFSQVGGFRPGSHACWHEARWCSGRHDTTFSGSTLLKATSGGRNRVPISVGQQAQRHCTCRVDTCPGRQASGCAPPSLRPSRFQHRRPVAFSDPAPHGLVRAKGFAAVSAEGSAHARPDWLLPTMRATASDSPPRPTVVAGGRLARTAGTSAAPNGRASSPAAGGPPVVGENPGRPFPPAGARVEVRAMTNPSSQPGHRGRPLAA